MYGQDVGFSINQIEALQAMLNTAQGDTEGGHLYGSALNPRSLHYGNEKKEIAKPGVKMEVKTNNRNTTGGAKVEQVEEQQEVKKPKEANPDDIWTEEEVNIQEEERPDDRPQPEFEVLYN